MSDHCKFMLAALKEAQKGQGFCAPNPAVGAVVLRDEAIIARGFHRGPGLPHAEVEALSGLQGDLRDCELYVSLEPCCHYGRTPPCTELIKKSGIKKVFFGFYDPNPQVAGQGQQQLRDAGIACDYLQLHEVDDFYRAYRYWWRHKLPWVTLKFAIDTHHNMAVAALTGPECQLYTHQQRLLHDALLTTVKTILHDDPQYNARLVDPSVKKALYVLDRRAELPLEASVFTSCDPITIFYHDAPDTKIAALNAAGVSCIQAPLCDGQLNLQFCLRKIAELGVHALWVESGWKSASALITQGLVQQLLFYVAPSSDGVAVQPFEFVYEPINERRVEFANLGKDLLIKLT